MVRPPISLLYAEIIPPCDVTISLQIDKPNPDIFLDLSVVNKGSNILFKSSFVPLPLSLISN